MTTQQMNNKQTQKLKAQSCNKSEAQAYLHQLLGDLLQPPPVHPPSLYMHLEDVVM
jgi:hypothetical protein